ncbi:eukaryotic porin/Tom40 [Lineolata rhizophorae]|uniref:Translocase of outer membrane 40 kDa subunit n=1 Tax=Lineolata rhizophorae TaxID=578093 RepID=A0A6A6PDT5_9PEZI|nr:eukaryotic porin/Tom40 [Lineolata rhizophorae]
MTDTASSALDALTSNAIVSKLGEWYGSFSDARGALGLPNPGTIDNINREVQRDVFLNNLTFSGMRADLTKTFSAGQPLFQVSHSLSIGSQGMPPYQYAAMYGTSNLFCQANIDNDFSLNGRFNARITPALTLKTQMQLAPQQGAMMQPELDYTGADFSASIKAMNPSVLEGNLTGLFIGSFLQSVTPKLALGLEGVWQRPTAAHGPEVMMSYAARFKSSDWIASAQLMAQGGIQASYWRRLTEKVEAGVDITLQFMGMSGAAAMMGQPKREGVTTIGAKYDFKMSTFRAQIDSQGKLGCLLEKRVAPPVQVTFAGEIDHAKNQGKVGLAVTIEGAGDDAIMESQAEAAANAPPPPF